jgi:histidinol-phosphate aminotransferase
LLDEFKTISYFGNILGGNDANFILVQVLNSEGKADSPAAFRLYKHLAETDGIVVRYRGMELGCEGCLRITIGTPQENAMLLTKLHYLNRLFH